MSVQATNGPVPVPIVPDDLLERDQWVLYDKDKLPYQTTGELAKSTDPATWSSYEVAKEALDNFCGRFVGTGFAFAKDGGISGIDLDDCLDGDGGLKAWAQPIVELFADTYIETSPSGHGLHIWVRGSLPGRGRKAYVDAAGNPLLGCKSSDEPGVDGVIEMYDSGRYFTFTGRAYRGAPLQLEDHAEDLKALYESLAGKTVSRPPAPTINGKISKGQRHNTLLSILGTMARRGMSKPAMYAALLAENASRCEPPYPDDHIRKMVDSIGSWDRPDGPVSISQAPSAHENGRSKRNILRESAAQLPDLVVYPFTDSGNAERVHALYGEIFRYSHPQKTFFVWDKTRWAEDSRGVMRHFARETARALYVQAWDVPDEKMKDSIIKHARKSEDSGAIASMLKEAGCIPGVAILPDELDRDSFVLNVLNGTLDLHTGELRPHRQEDLITKLAPVEYDPSAKCPRWLTFLAEVFEPHPDIPDFLQRAVGYSLTADTREECFFLCWGKKGRNGKGTFLKLITTMMGDYAGTADFSAFLVKRNNDGPRDDIANMRGRRLIRAEESNAGARLSEGLVKTLTGGDRVRARRLHENSYEFDPTWKIWLATNDKPKIRGTDGGIWSRPKLIPFEVTFAGREDRTLKDRLRSEMAGILAWAVEGCLRWQEEGLLFPESVLKATAEYKSESDHVGRFISEACEQHQTLYCQSRTLYLAYKAWAHECGEDELTETRFANRLKELGLEKKMCTKGSNKGRMEYSGISPVNVPSVEGR